MKIPRHVKNEKGSLSIEFLGILPFYFLFFLILWQVVASGYALMTLKSAANDGASVYSMTNDLNEARQTVRDSIGSGSVLTFDNLEVVSTSGSGNFKVTVKGTHPLIFVPSQWRDSTSISVKSSASGKVLSP